MKRIIFVLLTIFLMLFPICIRANEQNGYIVKIKERHGLLRFTLSNNIQEIGQNKGVYFVETQSDIEQLKLFGDIEYIEPDHEVTLFETPNDEYYFEQDNLHIVNVESAWYIGCYGNDVKIGVIDSGVYNHSELTDNLLAGYNYHDKNTDTTDTNGHGTFVSGLIASQRNEMGIVGIAHKSKIVPLKCFGTGMSSSLRYVIDAIYGAVDDFECQIINMSFGLDTNPDSLAEAIDYAASKDVIMVAAVGNDGMAKKYYPAAYENVIGVGSVNNNKTISGFSQINNSVFVTAPGNLVKSLSINGGYRIDTGTSFSTPLITGAMAIAKCIDKSISIDEAMALLIATSDDLGDEGYDISFGHGLLNIQALINKMLEGIDWFVSPLDKNDERYTVFVYNNSNNENIAASIFASYMEDKLIKTSISNVVLLAGQSVSIDFESVGTNVNHFLWSDLVSMTPLYIR